MNVIHVYLIFRKRGYVFGSLSAIFDYLTEDEVGIKKSTLLHRSGKLPIVTKRAIINKLTLLRKRRNDKKE